MMRLTAPSKTSCKTTRRKAISSKERAASARCACGSPAEARAVARAIYLYLENHAVLYLLTLYTKKEQADLTPEQKKAICAIVDEIKRAYRDRI